VYSSLYITHLMIDPQRYTSTLPRPGGWLADLPAPTTTRYDMTGPCRSSFWMCLTHRLARVIASGGQPTSLRPYTSRTEASVSFALEMMVHAVVSFRVPTCRLGSYADRFHLTAVLCYAVPCFALLFYAILPSSLPRIG